MNNKFFGIGLMFLSLLSLTTIFFVNSFLEFSLFFSLLTMYFSLNFLSGSFEFDYIKYFISNIFKISNTNWFTRIVFILLVLQVFISTYNFIFNNYSLENYISFFVITIPFVLFVIPNLIRNEYTENIQNYFGDVE